MTYDWANNKYPTKSGTVIQATSENMLHSAPKISQSNIKTLPPSDSIANSRGIAGNVPFIVSKEKGDKIKKEADTIPPSQLHTKVRNGKVTKTRSDKIQVGNVPFIVSGKTINDDTGTKYTDKRPHNYVNNQDGSRVKTLKTLGKILPHVVSQSGSISKTRVPLTKVVKKSKKNGNLDSGNSQKHGNVGSNVNTRITGDITSKTYGKSGYTASSLYKKFRNYVNIKSKNIHKLKNPNGGATLGFFGQGKIKAYRTKPVNSLSKVLSGYYRQKGSIGYPKTGKYQGTTAKHRYTGYKSGSSGDLENRSWNKLIDSPKPDKSSYAYKSPTVKNSSYPRYRTGSSAIGIKQTTGYRAPSYKASKTNYLVKTGIFQTSRRNSKTLNSYSSFRNSGSKSEYAYKGNSNSSIGRTGYGRKRYKRTIEKSW